MYKKMLLVMIEGIGITNEKYGNILTRTEMPYLNECFEKYSWSMLDVTNGSKDIPGNSYTSYYSIGACREEENILNIINTEIEKGDFFSRKNIQKLYNQLIEKKGALHIVGLLSNGNIHSNIRHLNALIELAKRKDLRKVYIHLILDGVDSLPREAMKNIEELQSVLDEKKIGRIASVIGRKYAMSKCNYANTKKAYDLIMSGKGKSVTDIYGELEEQYMQDKIDRNILPIAVLDKKGRKVQVDEGDGIVFFNFRPDRLISLVSAMVDPYFDKFETKNISNNIMTMTEIPLLGSYKNLESVYGNEKKEDIFLDYIYQKEISLINIYDDIKSYDFESTIYCNNVQRLKKYKEINKEKLKEEQKDTRHGRITNIVANSCKDIDYSTNVYEKIIENTKKVKKELVGQNDLIIYDISILDVMGHVGAIEDIESALEGVDESIRILDEECRKNDVTVIISSTHGLVESMIDKKTGEIDRKNTCSLVPVIITDHNLKLSTGYIHQIIPTIIDLMGLPLLDSWSDSLIV